MRRLLVSAVAVGALAVPGGAAWVAAAQPLGACGPDRATAVEDARRHTPHDPVSQAPYDPVPVAGNYDPCANLSTVLLRSAVPGRDAPIQAFLFNRGRFVGPAYEARPYTTLNPASTRDVVVLDFVTGRTCSACDDGTTEPVRYVWTGNSVLKLDPSPPDA